MTKKEILDYIMETPGNTNRQILSYLLDEISGGGDIKKYEYVKIADDDYEVSPSQTIENVYEGSVECTSMPTGDMIKIYFGDDGTEYELPLKGKSEEVSYYGDIDESTEQPIFDEYPVGISFTLDPNDVPIATIYSPEGGSGEYGIVIMDYKEVPADYSFLPIYEAIADDSPAEGVIRLIPTEAIESRSSSFILHSKRGSVDIYSIINMQDSDEMTAITYLFSEDSVPSSTIFFGNVTLALDETAVDITLGYYPPRVNMIEATVYKDALLDSNVKISIINSEEVSEHSARERITLTDISNTDVNNKYTCKFLQNTEYEVLIEQEGEEEGVTVAAKINGEENSSLSYIGGTCYLIIGEYSQDIDIKFTLSDEK